MRGTTCVPRNGVENWWTPVHWIIDTELVIRALSVCCAGVAGGFRGVKCTILCTVRKLSYPIEFCSSLSSVVRRSTAESATSHTFSFLPLHRRRLNGQYMWVYTRLTIHSMWRFC